MPLLVKYSVITFVSLILSVSGVGLLQAQVKTDLQPETERQGGESAGEITITAGLFGMVSGDRVQPFWLTANRHGFYEDGSANGVGFLSISRSGRLLNTGVEETGDQLLNWGGEITLLGRVSDQSSLYLHEANLSLSLGAFTLTAGRSADIYGHVAEGLSSGSAGMSGNASPVPRIALSVDQYTPLPLTGGMVEFKGHFAHGWMPDDRRVLDIPTNSPTGLNGSYLHDKSLYLRNGGNGALKVYFGMSHFAEWSGKTETGRQIPGSLNDFLSVMLARSGGQDTPGGEQVNALGGHTGIWDLGITFTARQSDVHLYHQHLFTDGSGLRMKNLRDGLYGLAITNPFGSRLIDRFLWEFLYTKHQSGPGLPDPMVGDSPDFCGNQANCGYEYNGRDDYYNNYFYLSGFSHRSRSLGNPLFLTRDRVRLGVGDFEPYSDRYFVSTRLVAHHLGLEGEFNHRLSWRLLATWNRHYGTYWGSNLGEPWGSLDPDLDQKEYLFNPPREQWYFLLETQWRVPHLDGLNVQFSLGVDRGDLFNTTGILTGIVFDLGTF